MAKRKLKIDLLTQSLTWTGLFKELSRRLATIKGTGERNLYLFKDFYLAYAWILQTVSAKLQSTGYQSDTTFLRLLEKLESTKSKEHGTHAFPAEMLLSRLGFSHFIELVKADDPLKRSFYEVQAIKNNWSKAIAGPCIRAIYNFLRRFVYIALVHTSGGGKGPGVCPLT